jgi:hypothetical protein
LCDERKIGQETNVTSCGRTPVQESLIISATTLPWARVVRFHQGNTRRESMKRRTFLKASSTTAGAIGVNSQLSEPAAEQPVRSRLGVRIRKFFRVYASIVRISVNDILTIDGLVRPAAVGISPPCKFCRSFVDPAEGLPFVNPGAPPDRPTQSPASEQRRPPNMPQRWMSKFSQLMAKSPLFIKLSGYSQIHS